MPAGTASAPSTRSTGARPSRCARRSRGVDRRTQSMNRRRSGSFDGRMSERPHILVVMVDQLSALFLRAYGHGVTKTPAIDRLAEEGVVFENGYTPTPLCGPARTAS